MNRLSTIASALLLSLTLYAGCSDTSDAPEMVPDEIDTTPPSVVSMIPADGTVGVFADEVVVIQFSEAMDPLTVENALEAGDLGAASMSWNDASDTLTIHPDAPLAYAQGQDPVLVEANSYTVVLGAAAMDLAGNSLDAGSATTFATLKELAIVFDIDNGESSCMGPVDLLCDSNDDFWIGDHVSGLGIRSAMTFDIDALPETTAAVTQAILATRQLPGMQEGAPYANLESNLLIDHVRYPKIADELESNIIATYDSCDIALAKLGDFASAPDQVVIQKDVTSAVADDFANRAERNSLSQYLLHFALESNGNGNTDAVYISRSLSELQVTYLVP